MNFNKIFEKSPINYESFKIMDNNSYLTDLDKFVVLKKIGAVMNQTGPILLVILVIAILIVSFFVLNKYHRVRYRRRYEVMKERFITYLNELDIENQRLGGHHGEKPRRDYNKLLSDKPLDSDN